MTINSVQLNTSSPFAGLGTATFNVVTAGLYTVAVTSTIPYVAAGSADTSTTAALDPAASALSILIKLNGSTVTGGTSVAPTPTQPSVGLTVRIQAAASDVITVVFSSSAQADAAPNAVKSIINLYQGE